MIKRKLLIFLVIVSFFTIVFAQESEHDDDDDDEADYSWDYDENSEDKPKISKNLLITLTRDWLGRYDPDASPGYGFFPAWALTLMIIACFFLLLAIISGLLHVIGCRGKRPKASERKASNGLIEIVRRASVTDRKHSIHSHDQGFVRKNSK